MSKPRFEPYNNKAKKHPSGTVIYIGQLKCRINLTPRTATDTDKEASMRAIRNAKFFERDEALYQMRRDHVRSAVGAGKRVERREKTAVGMQRNSLGEESAKSSHSKKISLPATPPSVPFLCIGNWPQSSCASFPRSQSQPSLPQQSPTSILHALPTHIRSSPRMFEAIPVKSFVMMTENPLENECGETKEAWGKSEFYRSYMALLSGPKAGSLENSPLRATSPVVVREEEEKTEMEETKGDWREHGNCYENRDTGIPPRISVESRSPPPPKVTSLTPQMVVHSDYISQSTSGAFKARALPAKLNTYKAAMIQKAGGKRQNSLEAFPNCTLPNPAKPTPVAPPPSEKAETRSTMKSYTVELRPKGFPPHRIPVDYAFFRRVKRLRQKEVHPGSL